MKKLFVILILSILYASNVYSQKILYDDMVFPEEGVKGNASISYWNKYNLYYYYKNYDCNLTATECQTAIQNAFNTWSQYSRFSFTQTYNPYQADIELSWEENNHSGCGPFTGTGLAHASIGKMNRTPPSYIHFRDTVTFTMTSSNYNLESVALHEIGHVLGLMHDDNYSAVMYDGYDYKTALTYYDLNALYDIYPYYIAGPNYVCPSSQPTFSIDNLPNGLFVSWELTNSFGSQDPHVYLVDSTTCRINNNLSSSYMGTLNAQIDYQGHLLDILQQPIVCYAGFYGVLTGTNQQFSPTSPVWLDPGSIASLKSPNLVNKNVSYSQTTPSSWYYSASLGELVVGYPNIQGYTPVVINIQNDPLVSTCDNSYQILVMPTSVLPHHSMRITSCDGTVSISVAAKVSMDELTPEVAQIVKAAVKDMDLSSWTLEIYDATSGKKIVRRTLDKDICTINTKDWVKGVYLVKANLGEKQLTEKFVVK